MKFLIVFFWSGLATALQCSSSQSCDNVKISQAFSCPKFVCSSGQVYHCIETKNSDRSKTCNKGLKAYYARCQCSDNAMNQLKKQRRLHKPNKSHKPNQVK